MTTNLERQIRSQPEELSRSAVRPTRPRSQVHIAAEGLHRAHRIWLVGTGTSLHAAELGAAHARRRPGRAAQVGAVHAVRRLGAPWWARRTRSS